MLIATGIYPPAVGGPARYAAELVSLWNTADVSAQVAVARRLSWLPPLVRHLGFFLICLIKAVRANVVFSLDTFSAAVPAYYAAKLLGKPFVVRVGGDFLWEMYTERTKKEVTLRSFCESIPSDLSFKEKIILSFVRRMLQGANLVVFSVSWYETLAHKAYGPFTRTAVVENPTGPREESALPHKKTFLFLGRPLFLKNAIRFRRAFRAAAEHYTDIELVEGTSGRDEYLAMLRQCYAVVVPSLSEVSPNTALDAIRCGKPLILTKESGYADRFAAAAIRVDPLDDVSLRNAIELLCDETVYRQATHVASMFPCDRLFADVASELLTLCKNVCAS